MYKLQDFAEKNNLKNFKQGTSITEATCLCPNHADTKNSLSLRILNDKIFLKCFAGCNNKDIIQKIGISWKELYVGEKRNMNSYGVKEYADEKHFSEDFLKEIGIRNSNNCVQIPYFDEKNNVVATRLRFHPDSKQRFAWARNSKMMPYGIWLKSLMTKHNHYVVAEGESDCHALWLHDIPALGIPGAAMFRREWTQYFEGKELYIHQESDFGGENFVKNIVKILGETGYKGKVRIISCKMHDVKDPSALHLKYPNNEDFVKAWNEIVDAGEKVEIFKSVDTYFIRPSKDRKSYSIDIVLLLRFFKENRNEIMKNIAEINDELKIWNERYWCSCFDDSIEKEIYNFFEKLCELTTKQITELLNLAKRCGFSKIIANGKNAIPFNNGTLYLDGDGTFSFKKNCWTMEDGAVFMIHEEFEDWMVSEERWRDTIVGKILYEFYKPEAVLEMKKFFGSILTPTINHQRALYLYGSGANAKGIIMNAFTALFNDEAVSWLNVSKWSQTHENIALATSILNVSNEITDREIGTDAFKSVISQDPLTLNPKYQMPIKIIPKSKHVFLANQLPVMRLGYAEKRRLILVAAIKSVPLSEQDPRIGEELFINRKYFINFALVGLLDFMNGGMKLNYSDAEITENLILENDSLAEFVEMKLQFSLGESISLDKIYSSFSCWEYETYGSLSPIKTMTRENFSKRIFNLTILLGMNVNRKRCVVNKRKQTIFENIKLLE